MRTLDLFQIQFGVSKINLTDDEKSYLLGQEDTAVDNYNNLITKSKNILQSDRLSNLNSQIKEHLKYYVEEILGYDAQLRVTQSWLNFNPKGTSHSSHNHNNSIVSGVIYLTKNPSPLMFYNPYPERDMVPVVKKQTPSNSRTFNLIPQENMLLLFPSYIPHAVPDNPVESTRITLAFNTFYTGVIGSERDVTLLELQ